MRVPKIFNLRADPFRGLRWLDILRSMVSRPQLGTDRRTKLVGEWLTSFKEFPSLEPNRFIIEQVVEVLMPKFVRYKSEPTDGGGLAQQTANHKPSRPPS
jgi:hypothetical protein